MARDVVLDSGAVSALANNEPAAVEALIRAVDAGSITYVPTAVVAESTTGKAFDARVNRVLNECEIVVLDESIARAAGALRARVQGAGTVDAIVVATADTLVGAWVLTGDPRDLRRLAAVRGRTTVIAL